MFNDIAKFGKVSLEQYTKDYYSAFPDTIHRFEGDEDELRSMIKVIYDSIKLPSRATSGSAGYDFFLPFKIDIPENTNIVIPTGIRCKMDSGWVLQMYPRSGHGFKSGIHLANTVGIIDQDYYNALNEGHIMIKLVNDSGISKRIEIDAGAGFCQGIFLPYGTAVEDEVTEERTGGFGSTTK